MTVPPRLSVPPTSSIDPAPHLMKAGTPGGMPPNAPNFWAPWHAIIAAAQTPAEVHASGMRNPYRWSFDRQTGDVYVGDVGGINEEVTYLDRWGTHP